MIFIAVFTAGFVAGVVVMLLWACWGDDGYRWW